MILLNSDTETQPTDAMREAIARARVGDEQRNEDPTVNALCERTAALLGKPAAIFLPTGAMCNVIAVKAHTVPGDLLLAQASSHVLRAESGGAAMISGVMTEPIIEPDESGVPPGTITVDTLRAVLGKAGVLPAPYRPPARLLCVEQTHNFSGGTIWPPDQLAGVCELAHESGLSVHMDGARLLNAVVASGIAASEHARHVDSVWIDFSKGLGAPMGAVLAGSEEFIAQARRFKTAVGGAMRQAGIIAAACVHALDHHVDRLAQDHEHAHILARGLSELPGVRLVYGMPDSNIVFFDVDAPDLDAATFAAACTERGVRVGPVAGSVRAVTHLQISRADIDTALRVAGQIINGANSD